jgi:hypothetical protein
MPCYQQCCIFTLGMDLTVSPETLLNTYQTTCYNYPNDHNISKKQKAWQILILRQSEDGWHDSAVRQQIQVSTDLSDKCIPKSGCLTQNCLLHIFLFCNKYCNPSTYIIPHLQWCKVVELPWSVASAWRSGWNSVIKCPWSREDEPKDWTVAVLKLREEF